ncbi:transposase [Rhizobium sp. SEMIA 4085]|uniref:IS66-like element accessory protein TnpA n=1 Tax=Rhizobium TaxID=379 RepID=UPI0010635FE9|nr:MULTISPECIES: transposase [Rhizobium]NNH33039.1 transposase [Rhizobium sp. SEMIA 4085]TDW16931.1 transposase [Rhizobium azibense]
MRCPPEKRWTPGEESDGQKLRVTVVHPSGRRAFDGVSKARLIESCLQPGASVAQLALAHGVNANLLWKWIRQHRLAKTDGLPPASTPAFIPVHLEAAAAGVVSRQDGGRPVDLRRSTPSVRLPAPDGSNQLSSPAKVNASLPNGVQLTLECSDVRAVAAVIGALGHVQTER